MTADTDDRLIWLINECFRNRLRKLIRVGPVLDRITFLSREQKERIINKARNDCDQTAADLLIETIVAGPRQPGWSRQFMDALSSAGCTYAAQIVETEKIPNASLEVENDCCVELIEILGSSLVEMKTPDVCYACYYCNLITEEDRQNILAETANRGNIAGARLLLNRIVIKPPGWFSDFLEVLKKTEHFDLHAELTGIRRGRDADESPQESSSSDESLAEPEGNEEKQRDGEGRSREQKGQREEAQEEAQRKMEGLTTEGEDDRDDLDLYTAEDGMTEGELSGKESSEECGDPKTQLTLRPYQLAVAEPALRGDNSIVCLPTGSGKTRIAVYVAKQHLDHRRQQGMPGKVMVIVNKVMLVEQHFTKEFGTFLKEDYLLEQVSGDTPNKQAIANTVTGHDIIICTAQILLNALLDTEDGISLSDITLLVVDECHHTHKGGVYQQIMAHYLSHKIDNLKKRKAGRDVTPLPQILGLTASLGVGGASKKEKAQEHILRICANLDAAVLMTAPLGEHIKDRQKQIIMAKRRTQDPFGDVIRRVMGKIEEHAQLSSTVAAGTQRYEQWVVEQEKQAAQDGDQRRRVCAEHLRQYNEALIQSNSIRMCDAYRLLHTFNRQELRKKEALTKTDTEKFLFKLFHDNQKKLEDFSKQPEYENNVLSELRTAILKKFTGPDKEVRGIIFTETRLSAQALHSWIQENGKFEDVQVRSSYLIGAGDQSAIKPMTSSEQRDVLRKFKQGEINLIIATTVAEEGLDIEKCNIVIRYCLVTNEIAMIQARGRGRADGSSYIVIGVEGSGVAERERLNEWKEDLMQKAIKGVQQMKKATYDKKVMEYQMEAWVEKKLRQRKSEEKGRRRVPPSAIKFRCRGCDVVASEGKDIEVIERAHHVNLTEDFRSKFNINTNSRREKMAQCEAEKYISCKKCGQFWGPMMCHRQLDCPCLNIGGFVVLQGDGEETLQSWTDLPVQFPEFDYYSHASEFVFDGEDI